MIFTNVPYVRFFPSFHVNLDKLVHEHETNPLFDTDTASGLWNQHELVSIGISFFREVVDLAANLLPIVGTYLVFEGLTVSSFRPPLNHHQNYSIHMIVFAAMKIL